MPTNYCLEVNGDFACFTRPEMKVERVSYDVITPSSARSIFEAIFWKPSIRWQITQIDVLKPIHWTSARRNELSNVVSSSSVTSAMKNNKGSLGIYIEEDRQQRAGLYLRDVSYRLYADLIFDQTKDVSAEYGKYTAMFERRALKGQCFNQPYLGCREFSCDFKLVLDNGNQKKPINETRSLGWMLYDLDYQNVSSPNPRFFNAEMKNGVILIPDWNSEEVRG
ncbi:MAG: type I-C CRISPR-associated protein Cas5 [Legionellales bacterium]|nr:type I-C CRISPR-associated protein Cas5 [Legionellales bacterium]